MLPSDICRPNRAIKCWFWLFSQCYILKHKLAIGTTSGHVLVDIDYACTETWCGYNNTATPTANLSSVGCTGGTVAPRATASRSPIEPVLKQTARYQFGGNPLARCSYRYSTGVIFTNVVIRAGREFNNSIDAVSAAFLVFLIFILAATTLLARLRNTRDRKFYEWCREANVTINQLFWLNITLQRGDDLIFSLINLSSAKMQKTRPGTTLAHTRRLGFWGTL